MKQYKTFEEEARDMEKEKGYIIVRCSGRDCDGVYFSSASKYNSYDEWINETTNDWFDGPVSYEIVDEEEPWNTWGLGWGIN